MATPSNKPCYFWFFIVFLVLAGYISQTSRSSDLMGSVDAISIALFLVAVFLSASLVGRYIAAIVCALIVVCAIVLMAGNHFYLALYQSFVPFSILKLAPESGALVQSFSIWLTSSVVVFLISIAWLSYSLVLGLTFPARRVLVPVGIIALTGSFILQITHDSRTFKHFSPFSESPAGYFLRSAGFIPFIIGSPYDERWANINGYVKSIKNGTLRKLPAEYLDAVEAFYPLRNNRESLYPLYANEKDAQIKKDNIEQRAMAQKKNVIVFVLESFRASESMVYGGHSQSAMPFIDELAGKSLRVNRFYATAPLTTKSETAINCGVLDYFGGAALSTRGVPFRLPCVPEILENHGYDTYWFHANNKDYYDRTIYLSRMGFTHSYGIEDLYNESYDQSHAMNAGRDSEQYPILGWGIPDPVLFDLALQELVKSEQPFYAEILSLSNHMPFSYDWEIQFPDYLQNQETMYDRYRRGLYYTDQALKGFMDKLQQSSLADNTVVVVTGDHGVWTFDDNKQLSDLNKHEQFFRVPLLIHGKNIEPVVIDAPASHLDIPPTLLSMLGINSPAAYIGRSLLDEPDRSVPIYTLLEASYGVRLGDQICVPENRCFRDGEIECDAYEREWSNKGNTICYEDRQGSMVGSTQQAITVPLKTLNHFDNLLNYMMLGLETGFAPEK